MYTTNPIVDKDGKLTQARVSSDQIKNVISQQVVDQKWGHTWWDEEVELTDGRKVIIRTVTADAGRSKSSIHRT